MKRMHHIYMAAAFLCVCLMPLSLFCQNFLTVEYRIGPKDLLEIKVLDMDELNVQVRVSEDGNITLPLLGEVEVEGLTKNEVERKLAGLLEERYLQDPQVTVFIKDYQSKRISLIGAINKPGSYPLLGRQTLLQIISEAGGLTLDAGGNIVVIRQLPDGTSTSIQISINDLILKGDASLNVPLEANDIINVPVDKLVSIYVFGQVKNPGALDVRISHIPTLLQAIAQAGGFSERASKTGVLIKWQDKEGKEHHRKVNVKDIIRGKIRDIQLKENDVVYVSETVF